MPLVFCVREQSRILDLGFQPMVVFMIMIIICIERVFILYPALVRSDSLPVSLDDLWFKLRGIDFVKDNALVQQLIDSYALIVVRNGEGSLFLDLHEYGLRADTVHIARPGQTIGADLQQHKTLEMYIIRFDIYQDSGAVDSFPLKGGIPVCIESKVLELCEIMLSSCRSDRELERFRGQSAFQELLYRLLKNIREHPDLNARGGLERTKLYIDGHFHESLSVDMLAAIAGLSPRYYGELFKKTYGLSVMDYVTQARVNSAKQLMVQSPARLSDIAHQVGFNDEFYFSRKFKKEVGVSPTVYLKNRRRRIVAYSSPVIGYLLPLNMIPYAAPLHPKWTAYYHKMYRADIPLHLSAYRYNHDWEANVDTLREAEPDLVIALDNLQLDERNRLQQIAPLGLIHAGEADWRMQFRQTASLVDTVLEAENWLKTYERKLSSARKKLSGRIGDERILMISMHKDQLYSCPVRGMKELIQDDLQLNLISDSTDTGLSSELTIEEIIQYAPDRILLNVRQESGTLDHWEKLKSSILWRDLKAVRRNQVHLIRSDPWREYSAYAFMRMLDDLLKQITDEYPK